MRRGENFVELPTGGRRGLKIEGGQPVAAEAVSSDFHAPRLLAEAGRAGRPTSLASYCLNRRSLLPR
jgi:hypothetical protein